MEVDWLAQSHTTSDWENMVSHPDLLTLSIFFCPCWPSAYLLWRNVGLGPLPIFFDWLFIYFLILSCLSYLHILEINPLLVKSFTNIFPHSVGCLFAMVVCAVQKLLCLFRSNLFIFVFLSIALGERSKGKKIAVIFVKECPAYAVL